MKRHIAHSLLVLLIMISHSTSFDDYYADDYSEEDLDYEKDFDKYDPGNYISWDDGDNRPRGPLNLKGTVRQQFALNTAVTSFYRSVVCSPMSVMLSLGKLALGAEGRCLDQLLRAIGLRDKKQLKTVFKPLINDLENLRGVRLHVISKIYVSKEVRLKSKYRKRARKIFKSSVKSMDFTKPASAVRTINDWVKKQTRQGISNVLTESDISPETSVVLVNAVYFAGFWDRKFDKVSDSTFYMAHGTRQMSMMTRRGNYRYVKSDSLDSQLVEIPYEGKKASFIIVLPNSKGGLALLLEKTRLAPSLLQEALNRLRPTDLVLSIPKFKTEIQMDLSNTALAALGVTKIFDSYDSGLEKIVRGEKNIHLSKAVHRAVIVVNELGTKAATSSVMEAVNIVGQLNVKIFNANHPFLYFILLEGEQLFAGTLAN